MKLIYCILLFLLFNEVSHSQTIINAERLGGGADSTIYSVSFLYNGTKGNSNTDRLNISPAFIFLRKKNEYKLFGDYSLLSAAGKGLLNSGFVHLRHNFKLTGRIKTFEFYQLQFNDILLLTKREVFGAGLRFSLLNKDSLKFDLGMGLMREIELLDETALLPDELSVTKYYRATSVGSIKWLLSKTITIDNVIYYQPYLEDFTDYRLLNDFNLVVSLTSNFGLITSLTTRYDSKPPGSLKTLDNMISFGFNMKF